MESKRYGYIIFKKYKLIVIEWNLIIFINIFEGEILGTIDSRLMNNSFAAVSPCGRFFGVCGLDLN